VTRSHLSIDEEYWLALRHPAEVGTAGKTLLDKNNPNFAALSGSDQDAVWREFRAYVRQAEGFYRGAAVLLWKSSPLNYYYSFMNLAKAMAVVRGVLSPKRPVTPRRLRHGLLAAVVNGTPDTWNLTTQRPTEIFPQLYEMVMGVQVAEGTELDARELLKYVSPIGWQLDKSGYGPRAWYPSYWIVATDDSGCWDIIAVPRDADLRQLPAVFHSDYQEVVPEAARDFARCCLRLQAVQAAAYRFLERKAPLPAIQPGTHNLGAIDNALRSAVPQCVFETLNGTEFQLAIGLPYRTGAAAVPMNEFIAAYAVMYFLSSLVRYHPDYMDAIGESSDAWLIESFAKSAPLHLLRYMASGVLGYALIIESA
jgi:hypothetical protein